MKRYLNFEKVKSEKNLSTVRLDRDVRSEENIGINAGQSVESVLRKLCEGEENKITYLMSHAVPVEMEVDDFQTELKELLKETALNTAVTFISKKLNESYRVCILKILNQVHFYTIYFERAFFSKKQIVFKYSNYFFFEKVYKIKSTRIFDKKTPKNYSVGLKKYTSCTRIVIKIPCSYTLATKIRY